MNKQQLEKLLDSLTLEQKIGQLYQGPSEAFAKDGAITGVSYVAWLNDEYMSNIGSTLNVYDNAKLRKIQEKHLEKNPIPIMVMGDIINGYRLIFPASIAQGCSFNPKLAEKACEITAFEASKNGISVTFSPMVDVSRDARWGRVTEGYGEDTLINCDFAKANVKGYQGKGVGTPNTIAACVKHFAAYGATHDGRDYAGVEMSERMLRENYLPPYKAAVDAGVEMLMPAFNTINGIPCTINKFLMNDVLRKEWGFDGIVVSDYNAIMGAYSEGAVNSMEQAAQFAIEAGVDIDMVDETYCKHIKNAIEKGNLTEEMIDKSVMKILEFKNKIGILDDPYKYIRNDSNVEELCSEQHEEFATDFVCQSSVLLKNDNNTLPIDKSEDTVFIGPYSDVNELFTRWSMVTPHRDKGISIEQALVQKFGDNRFKCYKGSPFLKQEENTNVRAYDDVVWGHEKEYLDKAVEAAKQAKNVVITIGEHANQFGEAHSRSDITISKVQRDLFDAVYEVNKNITVVLFSGRPLDIGDINKKAKAVLLVWFPGTYGAQGITDMLFGDRVPSGKLSMSFPQNVGQVPVFYEKKPTNHYNEEGWMNSNYGCRYIDIPNQPLYCFGHGLSYSAFEYKNMKISDTKMTRDKTLTVSVDVENKGKYDAYETVQMYIHDVQATMVSRPLKQLKAYDKVFIKTGETKTVSFEINEEMLKYYNYDMSYKSENGMFEVYLGKDSNSKDFVQFELI